MNANRNRLIAPRNVVNTKMLYSLGKVKGKDVFFTMQYSNLDAANADLYNNNVLIVDGKPTALPSVIMTHPFGIDKNWIIFYFDYFIIT